MAETKENNFQLDVKKTGESNAITMARNAQILQVHGGNHLTTEELERNKSDADSGTLHSPAPERRCNEKVLELSSKVFAPEQIAIRNEFQKIMMRYKKDIPHDLKIAAQYLVDDHENLAVELFSIEQSSSLLKNFYHKEFEKMHEKYVDVCVMEKQLEEEHEKLSKELRLKENLLVSLSYVDYFEKKYFPSWLLAADICRMWRWRVALKCTVSEEVYVLTERIRSTTFDIDSVTEAIVKIYGEGSKQEAHLDKHLLDIKTEAEWNTLLEKLGVDSEDDKQMLRTILEPVTREHLRFHDSAHNLRLKKDNCVFILHFKPNVTLDHEQIEKKFGTYYNKIENTLPFPEKSTKPKLAFLNLKSITSITRDDVIKVLKTDDDISQIQSKPLLEEE